MEEAISLNVTPLQAFLALVFQVWLVVFPLLILKKLNYLARLFEDRFPSSAEES